jgi:uncharacterized repeat protein (TIGR03843 family)
VLDSVDALELLRRGDMEIEGRLVDASNTTVRAVITAAGLTARCVYKPVRGERPLWDFPDGTLAGREVSAYLVARATGWDLVPPTILRDGPLGPGMVQLWVDEQEQQEPPLGFIPVRQLPKGWHVIASARDEQGKPYRLAHADDPRLARLAVFDAVINNADRKGAHILCTADGALRGVDHGVTFHTEPKLRTILWGWVDKPLPEEAVEVLARLAEAARGELGEQLAAHLTLGERAALADRITDLRDRGVFPSPSADWPAIPWPPL